MSSRLLGVAVILICFIAAAEFIKQNYLRFADDTRKISAVTSSYIKGHYALVTSDAGYILNNHSTEVINVLLSLGILLLIAVGWHLHMRYIYIASNFHLAEAELNELIQSYRSHRGRLQRTKERAEWYRDIAKREPPLFNLGDPFPRTVSDELIQANEAEIQSKRKKKNDCVMTAFLLSQLYRSAPAAARAKIEVESQRGKVPYVAPGIDYLVNENWRLIRYVVYKWGFP